MLKLDEIVAVIADTGVIADMSAFDPKATFEDNGVDSLDTYTVLMALEEKSGVSLENVDLEHVNSAVLVHAYINEESSKS